MNWNNIIKVRMERLGFSKPAETEKEYGDIFRRLQPVSTEYFTEPGRPPSIRNRALFDDVDYNRMLRQNQDIIKARFQGNTISYVFRDEFEIYASAFIKKFRNMDEASIELYTVLNQVGPMDKQQIMEELDLKGPVVSKILQKFQKAFMVYELQPDRFGEQVWQTFESEWPDFDIDRISTEDARKKVVMRFIKNMVAVDFDMVRDWTRFSKKDTKDVLESLESENLLSSIDNASDTIFYLPDDKAAVLNRMMVRVTPSVFVVHKADYLYRAFESKLKDRYKGREILQYLLIDGQFKGAVEGHWRIGPHDVEDIIIDLPIEMASARKEEIIRTVSEIYNLPHSKIIRYNGKAL